MHEGRLAEKLILIAAYRLVESRIEATPEAIREYLSVKLAELEARPMDKLISKLISVHRKLLESKALQSTR
jgi:hypothetical protein